MIDRKQWFLVGTGGFSRLIFFSLLIWTYLQIVFVSEFVFLTSPVPNCRGGVVNKIWIFGGQFWIFEAK